MTRASAEGPTLIDSGSARLCTLFLAALACAGCGLAEYEQKMKEAQGHLAKFEENNKLLGDMILIQLSDKNEPYLRPLSIVIRLPRGISTKEEKEQIGGLYYLYNADKSDQAEVPEQPDKGGKPPDKGAKPPDKGGKPAKPAVMPFRSVRLAFPSPGGNPAEKSKEVIEQVNRRFHPPEGKKEKTWKIQPYRRKEVQFASYDTEMEGGQIAIVNLTTRDGVSVAVIFVVDKDKRGSAAKLMESSLETLGIGMEATQMWGQWTLLHQKKQKPAPKAPKSAT